MMRELITEKNILNSYRFGIISILLFLRMFFLIRFSSLLFSIFLTIAGFLKYCLSFNSLRIFSLSTSLRNLFMLISTLSPGLMYTTAIFCFTYHVGFTYHVEKGCKAFLFISLMQITQMYPCLNH